MELILELKKIFLKNIWIVFVTGILCARLSYPLIKYLFLKISSRFPLELKNKLLSFSKAPYALLVLCAFWSVSLQFLSLEKHVNLLIVQPLKFIFGYSLILISYQVLDLLELYLQGFLKKNHDTLNKNLIPYSKKILKLILAFIVVLLVLQNSGFNVTSLLASLGLGGVAIALGAKETLSNLFGGLTIMIDKPFSVGDWIQCGKVEGTVEDVGFRSTKIKTFYDSLVTLPNSMVTNSIVDNLGRRKSRRTRVTLDLTYSTSPEKIEAFIEGVKSILKANSFVRQDYFQVYFSGYGASSLKIFINFFLKVSDWDEELLQKQNIFLEILKLSKKLEVSFAFPTQTLDIPFLPTTATQKQN